MVLVFLTIAANLFGFVIAYARCAASKFTGYWRDVANVHVAAVANADIVHVRITASLIPLCDRVIRHGLVATAASA